MTITEDLHRFFNERRRFYFPFDNQLTYIPKNGIYLIFENGEKYKDWDRIVRIGTHTGDDQLRSRLKQHFVKENKNRSIFRKNVGRCILNRDRDHYLDRWELDSTSKPDRERNAELIDIEFEKTIERQISLYVQNNLSFTAFQVNSRSERLFWESRLVSTLSTTLDFMPSETWFGRQSTKDKIRRYGLWQVNELTKTPLSLEEWRKLKTSIANSTF